MVAGPSSKLKVGAIIQARMKSERLPGKILMHLPFPHGNPLLWWVIQGAKKSKKIDTVVIATSTSGDDDILESFSANNSVELFRGSEKDVLSRFLKVTRLMKFDVVVRLTGDNPIIDSSILDEIINKHVANGNDYTKTKGLPLGMNFEIISAQALLRLEQEKLSSDDREHVTLFFRNNANLKTEEFLLFQNEGLDKLRLTIDYPSDFAAVSLIFELINSEGMPSIECVRQVKKTHPWIFRINESNPQRMQSI